MQNVVMLSIIMWYVTTLSLIMQNIVMLSVTMLNVSMQIAIKLSVNKHMITQRDTLLCVIQYNVITLSVVAQI